MSRSTRSGGTRRPAGSRTGATGTPGHRFQPAVQGRPDRGPLAGRVGATHGTDQRLADRCYGEWAGVSVAEVIARWGSVDAAPGVEPAPEVRARVLAALADIAESAAGTAVVVVSHDAVNRIDPGGARARPGRTGPGATRHGVLQHPGLPRQASGAADRSERPVLLGSGQPMVGSSTEPRGPSAARAHGQQSSPPANTERGTKTQEIP